MNKEEFIERVKEINANVPNEYFFLEYNKAIYKILDENEKLEQELKEWSLIFDTFSQREYAHKYLEERRKEIPNLLAPDSDEIYREYYKLRDRIDKVIKIIENDTDLNSQRQRQRLLEILKGE